MSYYYGLFSYDGDEDVLPLYESITEDKEPCCFCAKDTNEPMEFGKKITIDNITAHHFCLVRIILHPTQ